MLVTFMNSTSLPVHSSEKSGDVLWLNSLFSRAVILSFKGISSCCLHGHYQRNEFFLTGAPHTPLAVRKNIAYG